MKFRDALVRLYQRTATSLPPDVEGAIRTAHKREKGNAATVLSVILENIKTARSSQRPICQDTGVPVFYVRVPSGTHQRELTREILKATRAATRSVPLRANAVDVLTEKNSGDNTGDGFPLIYFEETGGHTIAVDLMLKGAGCENVGQLFKLPSDELKAERDLSGVRKCVLDTVWRAQGKGCPPYIIGVGIGATKDQVTILAKRQLLRKIHDVNRDTVIAGLEHRILRELNGLGIGPLGLGGRTTALGVKIGINHRHPASYFVDVSVSCWADRRARLIWSGSSCRIMQ